MDLRHAGPAIASHSAAATPPAPKFDPVWADAGRRAGPAAGGVPPLILGSAGSGAGAVPPWPGMAAGRAPPMAIPMDPKAYGAAVSGHAAALILFSVSWCAPCKVFKEEFEHAVTAVQEVNEDVVVGTVDCEAFPQFRAWEQIKEFPTVKFFRQGVSDPRQYTGAWSEAPLVQWVRQQFGLAPAAPPPSPPLISAAEQSAYLRAMRAMVERVRSPGGGTDGGRRGQGGGAGGGALVPTTDAASLSGETVDAQADASAARMADLSSSLAPLVGRMNGVQQTKFWERIRRAAAPGGGAAAATPPQSERQSFARRLAAEATRAETLGRLKADGFGDGDGDGDEHGGDGDHEHDVHDDTFTDWIADEEMPEGIDDALTD